MIKSDFERKQEKYQSLSQKYNETENSIKKTKEQISDLKLQLENIDKSNIDLNDKQTFIQEIQNALHVGDTCPIVVMKLSLSMNILSLMKLLRIKI